MENEKGVKLVLAGNMKASDVEGIRDRLIRAVLSRPQRSFFTGKSVATGGSRKAVSYDRTPTYV